MDSKNGEDDMHRVAEVYMNGGYRRAGETQSRRLFYPDIRMFSQYTSQNQQHYNNTFLTTAKYETFNIDASEHHSEISGCYTIFYNKLKGIIDNEQEFQTNEFPNPAMEFLEEPLTNTISWNSSRVINHPEWQDFSIPIH